MRSTDEPRLPPMVGVVAVLRAALSVIARAQARAPNNATAWRQDADAVMAQIRTVLRDDEGEADDDDRPARSAR